MNGIHIKAIKVNLIILFMVFITDDITQLIYSKLLIGDEIF